MPKKEKVMTRVINATVTETQKNLVEHYARLKETSVSNAIREMINEFFKEKKR